MIRNSPNPIKIIKAPTLLGSKVCTRHEVFRVLGGSFGLLGCFKGYCQGPTSLETRGSGSAFGAM